MGESQKLSAARYDVAVVGGGPGGLATAALLARAGRKVAVIERRPELGGRYRSMKFAGCRVDRGEHILTVIGDPVRDSSARRLFERLGLPLGQREIPWVMVLVGREGSSTNRETFAMDRSKGVRNFFEFFAFGSGFELNEMQRAEMEKTFHMMADLSPEACRRLVNVSFAEWLDRHVEDPLVRTVLYLTCPLMGAAADRVNVGQMANTFGAFPRIGATSFWYPAEGTLEDAIIAPLAKCIRDHGGEIVCGVRARRVLLDRGRVRGLWLQDEADCLSEIEAPAVVVAFPIQFAVGPGKLLDEDRLSPEWRSALGRFREMSHEDLSVFYLLRQRVVDEQSPGWVHLFDAAGGTPTYVGDWVLGDTINASVPAGKQLVGCYINTTEEGAPFSSREELPVVQRSIARWEAAMEKAFPGFRSQVEARVYNLQLNWGRYAYAVVPEEVRPACPTVPGLFFAGDSITSVGPIASEKVYDVAMECANAVLGS